MLDDIKKCKRCDTEKRLSEFNYYTTGALKSICKWCEISNFNKLWYCEVCDLLIRQKHNTRHLNSKRHLICYFTGGKYNYKNLQIQNKRKDYNTQ